ncbi:acyltransferase [Planctomycetota bacterium]
MLNPDNLQLCNEERKALDTWWSGNHEEPFVLLRHDPDFPVCDVLLPSWFDNLKLTIRYCVTRIAALMPASFLRVLVYRMLGVKIGHNVYIAPGAMIDAFYPQLIELGDSSFLGLGCRILAHEYTAVNFRIGKVCIGKGSVLGAYSTVRSGVTIGEKCTVGANSFVNRDVSDGDTVGGVPARSLHSTAEDSL